MVNSKKVQPLGFKRPNMFSDARKWMNIFLCCFILIGSGIHYFLKQDETLCGAGSEVCFFNTEIRKITSNTYVAVQGATTMFIENLPLSIRRSPGGEYAIKGYLRERNLLVIEAIRHKHPHSRKLLYSTVAAVAVFVLFFICFKPSRTGIVPRNRS